MTPDVVGPSVVGPDVVLGVGVLVLLLVVWPVSGEWVGSLVTVAHEGGHMVVGLLTGHRLKHFSMKDGDNDATAFAKARWGPGRIVSVFAGYVAPPAVGLAGASLVVAGKSWSLLWVAILLLLGAWSQFTGQLAGAVVFLAGAGIGYVAVAGAPQLQVALAVALVWVLLLGGLRSTLTLSRADGTDPARLANDTLVPRIVWHGVFVFVAIVCLWFGARAMLGL